MNQTSFPAPWNLTGFGYVFLFKASPEWLAEHGFIPDEIKNNYVPSIGTLMLVRYHDSNVGAYDELLFIPGKFQYPEGKRYTITRIFVSSQESVDNGQTNWGIPKERADFSISDIDAKHQKFCVSINGKEIFSAELRKGNFPFPVTTALLPKSLKTVVQDLEQHWVHTTPSAKGLSRFASIKNISADGTLFPDMSQVKILGGIHTQPFHMVFPEPEFYPK